MKPTEFDEFLAETVLEIAREQSLSATVERVVGLFVEAIAACDAAAVTIFEGGVPATVVATDVAIRDVIRAHAAEGCLPALTAYRTRKPVYSGDLGLDAPWPRYAEALTQTLGIHCLYALPLGVRDKPLAVLVLFAKSVDAFDEEEQQTARILAHHATAAVTDTVERAQLKEALDSRTVIGQATGMVMERFSLDAPAAFGVLRRLSQNENQRLRDIATRVVETGTVP
jgi:transcriptional regulator with GAF, ATPase, and Fis domain